jgi:tripartite-type tricarboxylate transporter receptor subunit TctC
MKKSLNMHLASQLALAVTLACAAGASQAYPDRPVTVVVPYAAGGSTDVLARILADALGKDLGQAVVVENVGGAGGTLGTSKVARSSKDGYTILMHNMAVATAPALYSKLGYDVQKDLEAVSLLGDVPMILVRSKRFAPATLAQLTAFMKEKPGGVNFAHAGIGATSHLCAMLFSQAAGTTSTLVAYRGTGPALQDLVAGNVDVICDQPVATGPHIQSGALGPYAVSAVSGEERLASLPAVQTFAQAGLPNFNPVVWHGLYVPKGTPAGVVARLNKAVQAALSRPELVQKFQDMGVVIPPLARQTPQAAQAFTLSELKRWEPIIKAVGVKAE